MLIWLLLMLIVIGVSLTVVLWAGTYFFQGYIYTEPSPGIFWQAPAAAALLTVGFTIWCLTIVFTAKATQQNIPIKSLLTFSPHEDMAEFEDKPAPKAVAILRHADSRKTADDKDFETKVDYECKRDNQKKFHYVLAKGDHRRWQDASRLIAIEIEKPDKTTMRFNLAPQDTGQYRSFVSPDGWVLTEIPGDGPIKGPSKFSYSRLILNLFFNFGHLFVWFVGLWLLLRFQWTHALGFAVVMWFAFTFVILPMMLSYAGLVAANRQAPTG